MSTTEESQQQGQGAALATQQPPRNAMLPLYNGVISPDKWTTFGRMARAFAKTEFVPKDLRGRPEAIMACLVFGDSLGLHPSTALKEVYIADGKPGISGALMLALIRNAGHRVIWEEIVNPDDPGPLKDGFVGWRCTGQRVKRGKVTDTDTWTYTLDDAVRAGLYPHSSPKAAWMKTPKVMCRWRALAQVARFLFSDVFVGQAIYLPDEAEEAAYSDRANRNGAPAQEGQQTGDGIDYGDDPLLAAWLIALFAAANEIEPGVWLPKKQKLALKGKAQAEREALANEVAAWIEERNGIVPPKPEDDEDGEREGEVIEDAEIVDDPDADPGAHLNGHDEHEGTAVD